MMTNSFQKVKADMRLIHYRSVPATALAVCLCCLQFAVPVTAQMRGGMLSPDIDTPGKPFSYFWQPTDVIGSLFGRVATEITPEGYLYTGFGNSLSKVERHMPEITNLTGRNSFL